MERLNNFDKHIAERRKKRGSEVDNLQNLEDELAGVRKSHMGSVNQHGGLKAEEKVIYRFLFYLRSCSIPGTQAQSRRIEESEALIRSIGAKYHLKGYDYSPLEREKVVEFISRFDDLRRRHNAETESLQVRSNYTQHLGGAGR